MKKILVLSFVTAFALLLSCKNVITKPNTYAAFGESFDTTHAVSVASVMNAMNGKTSQNVVVKGTVTSSCKKEGCWVKLDAGKGKELFVSTDEKFFLPKEGMPGKTVYVKGQAFLDTTSVADLRDYAKDAGKSDAEVNQITQSKVEVSMKATGIQVD